MPQPVLNARALKCTVVLDPAEVAQLVAPNGKPRVVIDIRLPDRRLPADLAAKSVRRALATIGEHGPDGVAVIIQGKLVGEPSPRRGSARSLRCGPKPRRRRRERCQPLRTPDDPHRPRRLPLPAPAAAQEAGGARGAGGDHREKQPPPDWEGGG